MPGQWIDGNYVDDSVLGGGNALAKAYAPGSLKMVTGPDGMYSAVNPRTGQLEPVYNDNDTSQMYFASDGQVPSSALPAGVPTYHSDTGFGTLDEFLSRVIPGALAAIPAAASLAAPAAAAAAGGTADAAATGGAAAAGGGSDATLQSILDSAAPAGESFTGPATGTVLEPGVQASGAFVNPVTATPTLAELGATPLSPLAAGAAGGAAAGGILSAVDGGTPAATSAATGATAPPEIGAGTAAAGGVAAGGALQALGLDQSGSPATTDETAALSNGIAGLPNGSASTVLGKILSGQDLSPDDLGKLLGTVGSTALSAYGTNEAANKLQAMNDQYMAIGAPSRARYEASFDPNFDVNSLPGFTNALNTSRDAVLRKFSTSGDPFGNPGQLTEAMNYLSGNLALPALNQYRNQNAATGGFGAFSTAAPGAATNAVGAGVGPYTSLASGAADIFNPPQSLADILKQSQSQSRGVFG